MPRPLDLINCGLSGTNLIEANAGTGKTYTITALTARIIMETDTPIEQILVVTFTKAAVSDLKDKVYKRLTALKTAFETGVCETDFEEKYVGSPKIHPELAAERLKNAIRDFDLSAILTIHSFCQRMLTEHSFSGRIAYDTKMTSDEDEILRKPVEDFWRREIYSLDERTAEVFAGDSPETFLQFLKRMRQNPTAAAINCPDSSGEEVKAAEKTLAEAFRKAADEFTCSHDQIFTLFFPADGESPMKGNIYKEATVNAAIETFSNQLLLNDMSFDKKLVCLTADKVEASVKKNKKIPEHNLFALVQSWAAAWTEYELGRNNLRTAMLLKLKKYSDEILDSHRLSISKQSFNDLITAMHTASADPAGSMAFAVTDKFKAALIDEFQDTDARQYDIFQNTFGRREFPFFMIGDPKQAIYSFRGADVYTYLKASENLNPFTLTENHRTDKDLVEAVNTVFRRPGAFAMDKIVYNDSMSRKEITVSINGKRLKPLRFWLSPLETSKESAAAATAFEIAELLNKKAEINDNGMKRQLRPSDFAVLVRNKNQAQSVKQSLSACRIPCVITSSENVFASLQAHETARLFAAAASPYDERAVRSALASDIFGHTAESLYELTESDGWENVFENFLELSDILNSKGPAPMFFRAARMTNLFERLAATPSGERKLTNFVHLAELAQKHAAEQKASPEQLLLWFFEKISESSERLEEYELKMDSDDNAVTITTIHKSKGLEYNIVFAPFLVFPAEIRRQSKLYCSYHDENERLVADFKTDQAAQALEDKEKLTEDVRLAYVALTRAKAMCVTCWGKAKGNSSSAFSHIFHGPDKGFDEAEFLAVFKDVPGTEIVSIPSGVPEIYNPEKPSAGTENRKFTAEISRPWQINSFSGLLHSSSSARDTEQQIAPSAGKAASADIFTFPKGARAGSCLHECMENIPLETVTRENVETAVKDAVEKYFFDEDFIKPITETVENILTRELIREVRLEGLTEYVHEMEFHIKTDRFGSQSLTKIFEDSGEDDFAAACGVLGFTSFQGFLTGFADLIFFSGGKYYILDWKSNYLGNAPEHYSKERMHDEMLRSHYYLQLYFYTLALHMHLRNTVENYDFDACMGGGIYVFMRGVEVMGENGIYFHRPSKEAIELMEKLVTGDE